MDEKSIPSPSQSESLDDAKWEAHKSNPRNWSPARRWLHVFAVSYLAMWMNLQGPGYLAGHTQVALSLHTTTILSILPTPMHTLGCTIGPIIGAPISESIGRLPVYCITVPIVMLFLLGSGLVYHIWGVCICRFFAGLFGSAIFAIASGGTIPDLFPVEGRVGPMAVFTCAGFIGPPLGFLVTAFPLQYTDDWRYTAWVPMMFGAISLLLLMTLRETRRDAIIRRLDSNQKLWPRTTSGIQRLRRLPYLTILQRPFKLLFTEPLVAVIGVYTAISFAITYGLLASVPYIFGHVYGFNLAQSGLTWIGSIVGYLIGVPLNLVLQRQVKEIMRKRPKQMLEWTLIPSIIGSPLIPVGCFWLGWSAKASVHWIVPVIGMGVYAVGACLCYNSSLAYLAQFYGPQYGASAAAGARMLSFYFGMAFPLFSLPLFENLGIDWGLSLFGFIGLALMPTPLLIYHIGPWLRARSAGGQ